MIEIADFIEQLRAEKLMLRDEVDRLRTEIKQLREALIFCSGSEDFQEGGQAREGWLKLCKPLIEP